jgi:alkylation response protein AidB-like acyl-CoA dehydrogenase
VPTRHAPSRARSTNGGCSPPPPWWGWQRARSISRSATSAAGSSSASRLGLARRQLDLTVAYVKERRQFGVPVGSFQAVQHRLADVATDLDGARLLVRKAAWAAQGGEPEAAVLAAMAFVWAAGTAHRVATESLHFHGGYGYTLDHDIQLFFRRATAWPLVLGDPDRELGRLGDLLYAGRR